MDVIADGKLLRHLYYLLEFLAAWEKRPGYLTLMAYQWCCAISEATRRLKQTEIPIIEPRSSQDELQLQLRHHQFRLQRRFRRHQLQPEPGIGLRLRLRQLDPTLGEGPKSLSLIVEGEFSEVGSGCGSVCLGGASRRARRPPFEDLTLDYGHLLSISLEIGFRPVPPGCTHPALHLNHTSHHDWIFETAFSSHDDDVVADAVCVWIADGDRTPPGSCARYLSKRVERDTDFSQRLREVGICAIERIWGSELKVSPLETVRLLDRLDVGLDDVVIKRKWGRLLVDVICSQAGPESLSPHYWCLLEELAAHGKFNTFFGLRCVEVMELLEEAEDWERLEIWAAVAWLSLISPELARDVEWVTLKLLWRQPSVLPRFEALCEMGVSWMDQGVELRRICDQARTPSESLLSYVFVRPAQHLLVLTRPFCFFLRFSQSIHSRSLFSPLWKATLFEFVYCTPRADVRKVGMSSFRTIWGGYMISRSSRPASQTMYI